MTGLKEQMESASVREESPKGSSHGVDELSSSTPALSIPQPVPKPCYQCFAVICNDKEILIEPFETFESSHSTVMVLSRIDGSVSLDASMNISKAKPDLVVFGIAGILSLPSGTFLVLVSRKSEVGDLWFGTVRRATTFEIIPITGDPEQDSSFLAGVKDMLNAMPLYYMGNADLTQPLCFQRPPAGQPSSNAESIMSSNLPEGELGDDAVPVKRRNSTDSHDEAHQDEGDLSSKFGRSGHDTKSCGTLWESANPRFIWNYAISSTLRSQGLHQWTVPLIQGFVEISPVPMQIPDRSSDPVFLCLLSRRASTRAGVRYQTRGMDARGNVANFVETEMTLYSVDKASNALGNLASFCIIRGSIPVFWHQPMGLRYNPRPQLDHSTRDTHPAFKSHMQRLLDSFGPITALDLVDSDNDEWVVGSEYARHIRLLSHPRVEYIHFDYHALCKGSSMANGLHMLQEATDSNRKILGWSDYQSSKTQNGVFRVNCIDCLDRTNVVQWRIARETLLDILKSWGCVDPSAKWGSQSLNSTENLAQRMWADNGDTLSQQYSGTGALKAEVTRTGKRSLEGMLNDGMKSIRRFYLSRFRDEARQDVVDLLLGNISLDPSDMNLNEKTTTSGGKLSVDVFRIMRTGAQRKAILEVDSIQGTVSHKFMPRMVRRTFNAKHGVKIHRCISDRLKAKIEFPDANHPYEYVFPSVSAREAVCAKIRHLSEGTRPRLESARVWCCTWKLEVLLAPENFQWIPRDHDVIAVCVQSCDYAPRHGIPLCEADITNEILSHLGDQFEVVCVQSLGAQRTLVFAKHAIIPLITNVETFATARSYALEADSNIPAWGSIIGVLFMVEDNSFLIANYQPPETVSDVAPMAKHVFAALAMGAPEMDIVQQVDVFFLAGPMGRPWKATPSQAAKRLLPQEDPLYLATKMQAHLIEFNEEVPTWPSETADTERGNGSKAEDSSTSGPQVNSSQWWPDRILVRSTKRLQSKITQYDRSFVQPGGRRPVFASLVVDIVQPPSASQTPSPENATGSTVITIKGVNCMKIKQDQGMNPIMRNLLSADTYLEVGSSFMTRHEHLRTSVQFRTLNPQWPEAITITPPDAPMEWLSMQELWLSVWDKGLRGEELIGQGTVQLSEACTAMRPVAIKCRLSLHGEHKAHIFGWIEIGEKSKQASLRSLLKDHGRRGVAALNQKIPFSSPAKGSPQKNSFDSAGTSAISRWFSGAG